MTEDDTDLINTIVISLIGGVAAVGLVAILVIIAAHYRNIWCKYCTRKNQYREENAVVSIEKPQRVQSVNKATSPEVEDTSLPTNSYITLEDHFKFLESPEREVEEKKEVQGHTLEFLPEDNTIIKVEGTKDRITRITRTKITIGDMVASHEKFSTHVGELNEEKIFIYIVPLGSAVFEEAKDHIKNKDSELPILTAHPRFIRYLGTCFNINKYEAYVISDFISGCTLMDMEKNRDLREVLNMSEEDRVQAAVDIAEAVYYLHNLSTPLVHQNISARNILVDGETLRFKLRAAEIQERIEDMIWCVNHGGIKDYLDRSNMLHIELAPEQLIHARKPDVKSDIWGLGGAILEILLEKKIWDFASLKNNDPEIEMEALNTFDLLRRAMEKGTPPSILSMLENSNPKLKFLVDCFHYSPTERPTTNLILRGLNHFLEEIMKEKVISGGHHSSWLYPGKKIILKNVRLGDPLVKQQVDWNVRQETTSRRRSFMIANRNYLGKEWTTLSANPINDIKDMANILSRCSYSTENIYENVGSAGDLEEILKAYVEAVNKDSEEIDIIVFYYAGYGVVGEPDQIRKRKHFAIFNDRPGMVYDLALVMCNESLFPVSQMLTIIAGLNSKVKRKLLILDCRESQESLNQRFSSKPTVPGLSRSLSTASEYRSSTASAYPSSAYRGIRGLKRKISKYDWEVPKIPEEVIETLSTFYTIRNMVVDPTVIPKAMDSHPRRMNGFLTGCLLQVLSENIPNISELERFLNSQMKVEGRRSRAHYGIECRAENSSSSSIWQAPLLTH